MAISRILSAMISGALLAGCVSLPQPPSLAGSHWQITEIAGEPVGDDIDATMHFETGGNLVGKAPCNQYGGQYQTDGETLRISGLYSTMKACVQRGRMERERALFNALEKTRRFTQTPEGTELALFSTSEQPLVRATMAGQ